MSEKPRRRYSPEFKAQAVELVGWAKPVPEVARELGFGANLLYRWVSQTSPSAQRRSCADCAGRMPN